MAKSILSRIGCMAAIIWLASDATDAIGQQVQAASAGWGYAETRDYDETVRRALALLPRRPERVVVIDVEKTPPALRQRLERVEAFVMVGKPTVCLRMQGSVLKNAQRSGGLFDYALAAIIWHEMAHISGADERGAQEQEERLWRQFIVGRRVDTSRALAYLARLEKRREGDGSAHGKALYSTESAR
jgi:hypothetical protein